MNKVKDKLPALVEEELAAAMEKHPLFASAHEGYAVLLEEVEEAEAELNSLQHAVKWLWGWAKADDLGRVKISAVEAYSKAINLAAEAIQVAAMAQKLLASLGTEKVTP